MLDKFERVLEFNERKKLHCSVCKRMTIHNLEARCIGVWHDPGNHNSGDNEYSIFRCGACDEVCYETSMRDDYDVDIDEDGEQYYSRQDIQYPAPVSSHFNFNTESTPFELDLILDEMLYALAGQKMRLATIGLRLAVEFIVNDKECQGRTLLQKIDDLHRQELVDDDQKELLHRIRKKGNDGAHKAKGMSLKEMIAGMSIIEGLLEKLYNGPARHAKTIKNAKMLLKEEVSNPDQ
jgi:hypothetical protein